MFYFVGILVLQMFIRSVIMSKNVNWIERKERSYLKDVIPLDVPFSMQVELIRACNFKCIYCIHSTDKKQKLQKHILSASLFEKFVNDFKKFGRNLKTITFSGIGEPMLNPDIYKIINMSKEISDKVVLITNGSLINEETVEKLTSTKLDTIRISLQGLCAEDYEKTCGYKIDFAEFLKNLSYLFENKKGIEVCLKIPDIVINSKEKEFAAKQIFEDKCDIFTIQSISPLHNSVDYSKVKDEYNQTMYCDNALKEVTVCPQPFYSMQLMADGSVRPCCMLEVECYTVGNINDESIIDIWNGEKLKNLRCLHLDGQRELIPSCKACNYPKYLDNHYDNLDNNRINLIQKFK